MLQIDNVLKAGDVLNVPQRSDEVIEFLRLRRSNLAKVMAEPGPDQDTLENLLIIAARVPDHRKITPWRFIVFTGEARRRFGDVLGPAFARQHPEADAERVQFEAERFMRAPVVVAVISSPIDCPRGTPEWEQALSTGAVCFNLCLAAQAHGFAAQWLSEWYAYDADVGQAMGLNACEQVAGFIYIGTASEAPSERARPDMATKITYWT